MNFYYKIRDWISKLVQSHDEPIQEPYIEQSTECDSCHRLQECIDGNRVLNITVSMDKYNRYMPGLNGCLSGGKSNG